MKEEKTSRNNQANDIIKRYAAISVFKGRGSSTHKDSASAKRPTNKTFFNQTISSTFNPNIDINTLNSFFKVPNQIEE